MTARRKQQTRVHSEREIRCIRTAARTTATVLSRVAQAVRPGVSTDAIDAHATQLIEETGGSCAFHNYRGFPGHICISVNDVVVHGIGRSDCIIQPGDLVSLDVGVRLNGCVGDTALTICAGVPNATGARLMEATQKGLSAGIDAARPGQFVNDIGRAVEKAVLPYGFQIVRAFVGHGCGCELHEPPEVPNFKCNDRGPRLQPGMVLAVEPMVNAGTADIQVDDDGWTARTADRSLSAHFEHMILITNDKPEILTWRKTA